jgi:hypothetical protein
MSENVDVHDDTEININEGTINILYRMKLELEARSMTDTNDDLKIIIQNIDKYLRDHCVHKIVYDYIDLSNERSIMISYCEKCYTTIP